MFERMLWGELIMAGLTVGIADRLHIIYPCPDMLVLTRMHAYVIPVPLSKALIGLVDATSADTSAGAPTGRNFTGCVVE
jgi:hypothetical protein